MPKPLVQSADPAYNILRTFTQPLDAIFTPKTVAVIGATEKAGSVGRISGQFP